MKAVLDDLLQRVLPAWIGRVEQRAGAVLLAAVLLTPLAGVYAAGNLSLDTNTDSMFDERLPHRVAEIEYHEIFPNLYENIVILVDARNAEQARESAARLAEKLEAAPDLFSAVHLPQSEFLEDHALLYMETEELEDLADRLARVQPYLASLASDGTLRGLAMMLARGVHAWRDGEVSQANLEPMLERVDLALRAQLTGQPYHLSWAEVVAGRALEEESNRRLILAQPIRDFGEVVAAEKPLNAVKRFAEELGLTEENGVRVRMTGDVALEYEEMELVESQAVGAGVASFVMVSGLLFAALRSVRLVSAAILTLIVGLVWTGFFAAVAVGHLNLLSVAFAVLFIGLGIDFAVHLCMGYQEGLADGYSHRRALERAARTVGSSLVLCATTTAIGFYVFVPTDFSGVAELGLISGTGMFVSLFLSFSVLPALLSFRLREGSARRTAKRARVNLVPTFPVRYPRAVAVTTVIVALSAASLLPRAHFDENPLRVRDPSAESVQAFEELLAQSRTSPWSLNAIAPDLESAESLAGDLARLPSVENARTVNSYVPKNQDEKLAIIEDVALFLAPRPTADGAVPRPTAEESLEALRDFEHELQKLARSPRAMERVPPIAKAVLDSLGQFLARSETERPEALAQALDSLEESLLGTLPDQLDQIERAVAVGPISLETLPESLVERMISASGHVRVQIFPREDLTDPAAMARFVEEVRTVAPKATGSAVAIYSASREVVKALQQAFASALVAIALLLFLIWRAVGDMAMVMAPLGLAGLLTSAAAVAMGIPFNFADIIVLPLLLGIGVDSSIHLVHRARTAGSGDGNLLETSTANAVVFSALTTLASFGSLAFASHRGMASLGQLLSLGVALTVVCNLVVLPALLKLRSSWAERVAEGA